MINKASFLIIASLFFLLSAKEICAQELTARWEVGIGDYYMHNQTSADYYFNKRWGVNMGLDIGSGNSYRNSGYPNYYSYIDDVKFRQVKFGVVRRFWVGKFFGEPFFGLAYGIQPSNLFVNGDKTTNSGVDVTGGLEIQGGIEYNITKKWALRFAYSVNNTDYITSLGLRYSFFYEEK